MSVDLGLRHDRLLREQAVELFERGCGYALTARRLGVPAETVREWQKMYRAIGRNGLFGLFAFKGVGGGGIPRSGGGSVGGSFGG